MISWGISANSHDAAVAVFFDEKLVFASHSERFSKIKNDADLPNSMINYLKERWGGMPDQVFWYENPWLKNSKTAQSWTRFKFI